MREKMPRVFQCGLCKKVIRGWIGMEVGQGTVHGKPAYFCQDCTRRLAKEQEHTSHA